MIKSENKFMYMDLFFSPKYNRFIFLVLRLISFTNFIWKFIINTPMTDKQETEAKKHNLVG